MPTDELFTAISKTETPDEDFKDFLGSVSLMDDRVYIEVNDGICLGFDRYVLNELLRREKEVT
jgi:hypothetical protein